MNPHSLLAFSDLPAARLALLGESCKIANGSGKEYAVCGGWSPFLRNSSRFLHPGTKDVDLLFSDGVEVNGLKEVFGAFRECGFLPSAKHEFQLIRVYSVGGIQMAFNVDLLHPTEGKVLGDMFVEHVELPVLEGSGAVISMFKEKSIAAPYSKFVFAGFIENELVKYPHGDGSSATIRIPVIDEVGVLVTKSESCVSQKRPRDLFDIFLAISQPRDGELFCKRLDRVKEYHPAAFKLIGNIRKAYQGKDGMSPPTRTVFDSAGLTSSKLQRKLKRFWIGWDSLKRV